MMDRSWARLSVGLATLCTLAVWSPEARAQDDPPLGDDLETVEDALSEEELEKAKEGWSSSVKVGLSFNFNNSQNVVGTDDGTTLGFGLVLGGNLEWRRGQQRWVNTLSITETVNRTPQLERLVKSFDLLDLQSLYVYKLKKPEWLGVFGRFTLQTPIFPGNAIRIDPVQTVDADDNPLDTFGEQEFIDLTSAFEPLQLRQAVGLFADPYRTDPLTIEIQTGVAVQEIITQDGFVITDEADGDVVIDGETLPGRIITLEQLENVVDFGGELQLKLFGEPVKEVLTYSLTANLFLPAVSTADEGLDFAEALNLKIGGNLGVKVSEYVSVEYTLNVIRQPRVTDEFQVQNGVVVSGNFTLL
ncbi:MAG: hypothetical protein ACFB9M_13580 [Myxococcota bacterium]